MSSAGSGVSTGPTLGWRSSVSSGLPCSACCKGSWIAVGLSILAFLWRAWHPYDAVLGRADEVKGYHDITRYTEARQVPGLVLFRFDAPLFFANAGVFRTRLLAAVRQG